MNTVTIIVLGIVVVSIFGVIGDLVAKVSQAKIKARAGDQSGPSSDRREVEDLHRRMGALETRLEEREDAIRKLQEEVRFVSRMLEDRSSGS